MKVSYIPPVEEALQKARLMSESDAFSALIEGVFGPKGCPSYDAVESMLKNIADKRNEHRAEIALNIAKDANNIASQARSDARDARIIALIAAVISAVTALVTTYFKLSP